MGKVETIKESDDQLVRSCTVSYTVPSSKDPASKYSGGKKILVTRSIQRLTLILPVEEQLKHMKVLDDKVVLDDSDNTKEDLGAEVFLVKSKEYENSFQEDLIAEASHLKASKTDDCFQQDLVAEDLSCQDMVDEGSSEENLVAEDLPYHVKLEEDSSQENPVTEDPSGEHLVAEERTIRRDLISSSKKNRPMKNTW